MATQTWTVKTVVSCIRLTVRISSARHGVDVSPPLRLLVPNPDTVRFSYIMERGTGSGLLLKMFCGTPVALRFCFLMQKHVHSWWYRHQLKIGRCSRVCPVMEGSFRGIAQNGLRDPTFFLFLGPQVFFFYVSRTAWWPRRTLSSWRAILVLARLGWDGSIMFNTQQPSCGILGRPWYPLVEVSVESPNKSSMVESTNGCSSDIIIPILVGPKRAFLCIYIQRESISRWSRWCLLRFVFLHSLFIIY